MEAAVGRVHGDGRVEADNISLLPAARARVLTLREAGHALDNSIVMVETVGGHAHLVHPVSYLSCPVDFLPRYLLPPSTTNPPPYSPCRLACVRLCTWAGLATHPPIHLGSWCHLPLRVEATAHEVSPVMTGQDDNETLQNKVRRQVGVL